MHNFDSGRLSHAYICGGALADLIAATVVCSDRRVTGPCNECKHCRKANRNIHPDIITITKQSDKRYIDVDQIRELKRDVIVVSNEALQKAYIINDAHLMNLNAQNAFLQILEEPPAHVVFILKTDYPSKFIPTILSRCVVMRDTPTRLLNETDREITSRAIAFNETHETDEIDSDKLAIEFFEALSKGNMAITEMMFTLEKLSKEQFADFLFSSRKRAVFLLSKVDDSGNMLPKKTISYAEELLSQAYIYLDQNVNIGHISGLISASLIKNNNK